MSHYSRHNLIRQWLFLAPFVLVLVVGIYAAQQGVTLADVSMWISFLFAQVVRVAWGTMTVFQNTFTWWI